MANNVRLEFDPPLENSRKGEISDMGFIKYGVSSMPPGYEMRTFFDTSISYFSEKNNLPLTYKVKISYLGGIKSELRYIEQILDLKSIESMYISEKGLDDLVKEIEKLNQSVSNIAGKLDKMPKPYLSWRRGNQNEQNDKDIG